MKIARSPARVGFKDFVGGVSYQKDFESGQNLVSLSKSFPQCRPH